MRRLVFILLAVAACSQTTTDVPDAAPADAATPGDAAAPTDGAPSSDASDAGAPACGDAGSGARIVAPTFARPSVVVAMKDVVNDYGADATGKTDVTAIVQKALTDVAALGGGTLWMPKGIYRFDGSIAMPGGVTLAGDWKQPTASDKKVDGTVLAIHAPGTFLTFTSDASVDGLTFWYPDQSLTTPIQSTAIGFVTPGKSTVHSVTIRDVTFVNPWIAIDTTTPSGDTGGNHLLYNVYGAALSTGTILRKTSSTSRNEEQHFAARYWSDSGLAGAPSYADLAAYMQKNATAVVYLDNWGTYNLTTEDFGTGIEFNGPAEDKTVTGEEIVGLEISGAKVGIDLEQGNTFYVTDGKISASDTAIYASASLGKESLLLDEVTLASGGNAIDSESTQFTTNVMTTTFSSWSGYAIKAVGGDVIVAGSTFQQTGNKDLSLGASVSKAVVMSNTFADGFTMDSAINQKNVWVDDDQLKLAGGVKGFATSGLGTELVTPAQPKPARTDPSSLYDVTCFGAVADCTSDQFDAKSGALTGKCTDDTAAFQAALDAAGSAGGGTVYVPASRTTATYFFAGHLAIPKGVELLGADADRLVRVSDTRTLLVIEGDDKPFVTLAAKAGVRGLSFWYANQDGYQPQDIGWTIQAQGAADWVVNVDLPNATSGVDFGTVGSDGHYIVNLSSQSYVSPLYVSKSSSGFIGDYQGSGGGGNSGGALDYPTTPNNPPLDEYDEQGNTPGDGWTDTDVGQIADAYKNGVGILLGGAKNEVILNAYVHSPHVGLKTVADGSYGGPSLTLIHFGSETFTGIDVEALDPAGMKVVETEYHTIAIDGYPQMKVRDIAGAPYLVVGSGVDASTPITFFTFSNHSSTPVGLDISGGKVVLQQYFSDQNGNSVAPVTTAVAVHNAATGFAMVSGKFLNALDPGMTLTNDASPNVALAGVRLVSPLQTTGTVDLGFQPPM
ncbi:MAG TPA: glycosyl hydrolase family 28-related protein [Polyangiaceae bacterium]|jgi:hypothetical protein